MMMEGQAEEAAGSTTSSPQASELLLGGAAAEMLSPLRSTMATGKEEAISVALKQLLGEGERILVSKTPVIMSLQQRSTEGENASFQNKPGQLIITSDRFLFVSTTGNDNDSHDFSVGAECIQLHAESDDPELSVYVQVQEGEDGDPVEVIIVPQDDKKQMCEIVFGKMREMIALHPVAPNDDDDEMGGGMMGFMGSMLGGGVQTDYGDDMIIATSPQQDDDAGATPEERAAMLDRLDQMLVVKPGLEKAAVSQQFDDAEE